MAALTAVARKDPGAEVPLVCVLDIKMVGLSGFDILRWMRSQHELDSLPVLMFSSSDHPADVQTARDLGAQGYLKSQGYTDVINLTGGIDAWALQVEPEMKRY